MAAAGAQHASRASRSLDRDHGDGRPLLAWIEQLLVRAGVHDADGEIWLHCFPRMLGYAFNPVSFWFCERRDGALRAIVCEVHNTFGERHCYVLAHDDDRPIAWGETLRARKVFHVSPFCAVAGSYRFRFLLAARADGTHFVARIDPRRLRAVRCCRPRSPAAWFRSTNARWRARPGPTRCSPSA